MAGIGNMAAFALLLLICASKGSAFSARETPRHFLSARHLHGLHRVNGMPFLSSSSRFFPTTTRLQERGPMDEMNFFDADIPDEVRKDIFEAEGKTQAGQDRAGRLANYAAVVVLGLGIAIFNTFLTGLQDDGTTLATSGFGWVNDNPVNSFLFTSKIGGGIALISAGLSAVLSEVELRGRRDNVEKIWLEFQRRKEERGKSGSRAAPGSKKKKKGKKMQKQAKRLSALSEVLSEDTRANAVPSIDDEKKSDTVKINAVDNAGASEEKLEEGIMGKLKGFYDKADSMAASQALLLNKELEDKGIVDKITDETGLKVIGKEAAAEIKKAGEKIDEKEGGGK